MIRWIRSHPYTLLAAFIVAGVIAWNVMWPRPWQEYLWAVAGAVGSMLYGWVTRCRSEPPSSLPCPPECHIRVEHRHDPVGSF